MGFDFRIPTIKTPTVNVPTFNAASAVNINLSHLKYITPTVDQVSNRIIHPLIKNTTKNIVKPIVHIIDHDLKPTLAHTVDNLKNEARDSEIALQHVGINISHGIKDVISIVKPDTSKVMITVLIGGVIVYLVWKGYTSNTMTQNIKTISESGKSTVSGAISATR